MPQSRPGVNTSSKWKRLMSSGSRLATRKQPPEKWLAERDLGIEILKEINAKSSKPAGAVQAIGLRTCTRAESAPCLRLIGISWATLSYQLRPLAAQEDADAAVAVARVLCRELLHRCGRRRILCRLRAELVAHASPLAPSWPAGARQTSAHADRLDTPAHPYAFQGEHDLSL